MQPTRTQHIRPRSTRLYRGPGDKPPDDPWGLQEERLVAPRVSYVWVKVDSITCQVISICFTRLSSRALYVSRS